MSKEELEQKRIDDEERFENLEKCIGRIKDTIQSVINQPIEKINREQLEEVIEEIEWEIRCLE